MSRLADNYQQAITLDDNFYMDAKRATRYRVALYIYIRKLYVNDRNGCCGLHDPDADHGLHDRHVQVSDLCLVLADVLRNLPV